MRRGLARVPSDFVPRARAAECAAFVQEQFREAHIDRYGVRVHGAGDYPEKLRDAAHPIELIYYQGWWDLVDSRSVAVVGTRKPTPEGLKRTRQLVRKLVKDDFTIVSGLAAGIDTAAHETAIEEGRPHDRCHRDAAVAQLSARQCRTAAKDRERISAHQPGAGAALRKRRNIWQNRLFFPERNITMSALTEATIIVEAGETSGTLVQARAALQQGRKLFILDSCFRKKTLTWPATVCRSEERSGWRTMRTSGSTFPQRLTKIDDLTRPDHSYLTAADDCYFIGEYTARKGYAFSATNNLIVNLKKPMDRRGRPEWPYKGSAIETAAAMFRSALKDKARETLTFVPVPPSKAKGDPLYDDRVEQVLGGSGRDSGSMCASW